MAYSNWLKNWPSLASTCYGPFLTEDVRDSSWGLLFAKHVAPSTPEPGSPPNITFPQLHLHKRASTGVDQMSLFFKKHFCALLTDFFLNFQKIITPSLRNASVMGFQRFMGTEEQRGAPCSFF